MVNKKGFLKTIEAVIAIILVVVVSYALIPQYLERPPEPPIVIQDAMNYVNQKVEHDIYVRETLVPYDGKTPPSTWPVFPFDPEDHPIEGYLTALVQDAAPTLYDFSCAACSAPHLCIINTPIDRNVYPTEVFIASGAGTQDPKIVRVWFWERLTGEERTKFENDNSLYYNKCFDCVKLNNHPDGAKSCVG